MEGGSHLLHHQQHHQQQSVHHHMQQQQQMSMSGGAAGPMSSTGVGGSGLDTGGVGALDNRFPQWSIQETKEFLMIRGELDQTFMETKRNKLLWEITSTRMREKGFNRSSEQCKCKWKNLVTRYKGCETMEPEAMRQQFPYYNEMQAIFTDRMQRMLWTEAGGGGATTPHGSSKNKNIATTFQQFSSEEEDDDQDSDLQYNYGEKPIITTTTPTTTTVPSSGFSRKVRKPKSKTTLANISTGGATSSGTGGAGGGNNNNSNFIALKELLEDFMKQQVQMEMQWREMYEAREEERRMKEMEWRQRMEALENERLMMERRWIEREEQRRIRDEARADKRDALITALLNKLRRDES